MISVPLRSRRQTRAKTAQKLQHLIPAFPLLFAGLETLRHDPHGLALVLGVFEVVTSVLLFGTTIRGIRALRRAKSSGGGEAHAADHAHGIDWFDVFASGVLFAEAAEHWHQTHHWRRPVLLTAAFMLVIGLLHGRIAAWAEDKRALKVSDDGISVGRRPFGIFRATWAELESIQVGGRYGTIRRRDGRERRIDLQDSDNAAALRNALAQAQSRIVPASD